MSERRFHRCRRIFLVARSRGTCPAGITSRSLPGPRRRSVGNEAEKGFTLAAHAGTLPKVTNGSTPVEPLFQSSGNFFPIGYTEDCGRTGDRRSLSSNVPERAAPTARTRCCAAGRISRRCRRKTIPSPSRSCCNVRRGFHRALFQQGRAIRRRRGPRSKPRANRGAPRRVRRGGRRGACDPRTPPSRPLGREARRAGWRWRHNSTGASEAAAWRVTSRMTKASFDSCFVHLQVKTGVVECRQRRRHVVRVDEEGTVGVGEPRRRAGSGNRAGAARPSRRSNETASANSALPPAPRPALGLAARPRERAGSGVTCIAVLGQKKPWRRRTIWRRPSRLMRISSPARLRVSLGGEFIEALLETHPRDPRHTLPRK